jgi:hypothetical protein
MDILQRIERELPELDHLARIGASGTLVTALLGLQDRMNFRAHCHAGALTISPILLENLPQTANAFYEMLRDQRREVSLKEHHIVDSFLRNLINALPRGSCWLGITRLTSAEAWAKDSANMAYYEFQTIAERRTKDGDLNYFRLWSLHDEEHVGRMRSLMTDQCSAGFRTRYATGALLDDISIIWIPARESGRLAAVEVSSPLDTLESQPDKFEPLCAIEFTRVRGARELDEMTISSPTTDKFKELCLYFRRHWESATSLPETATQTRD